MIHAENDTKFEVSGQPIEIVREMFTIIGLILDKAKKSDKELHERIVKDLRGVAECGDVTEYFGNILKEKKKAKVTVMEIDTDSVEDALKKIEELDLPEVEKETVRKEILKFANRDKEEK